ncbi:MAG: hypothetical protein ACK4OO_00055 [bacterium]
MISGKLNPFSPFEKWKIRTIFIAVLGGILVADLPSGLAQNWKNLKPSNDVGTVKMTVKGKDFYYYPLSAKEWLKFEVEGPTRIKVVTRAQVPARTSVRTYHIIGKRDNKKNYYLTRSTKPSDKVEPFTKGIAIGESRSIYFKVPKGKHIYEFSVPKDQSDPVWIRVLGERKKIKSQTPSKVQTKPKSASSANTSPRKSSGKEYVGFAPLNGAEEVEVVVKEEIFTYHRATADRVVEVEIIGPAELKVVSRLEIKPSMRGTVSYRVKVEKNGQTVATYPFKAKPSGVASYKMPTSTILSRGDTFILKVPEGKHRYRVFTPDPDTSILVKFYIPRQNLGNELPGGDLPRTKVG